VVTTTNRKQENPQSRQRLWTSEGEVTDLPLTDKKDLSLAIGTGFMLLTFILSKC
jgi:hypothetical protein